MSHPSGGLTKDYLYLKGFRMMLNHYQSGHALTHLLVGKTALAYLPVLEELVNRNILKTPQYITDSFYSVKPIDPILSYLVNCLQ